MTLVCIYLTEILKHYNNVQNELDKVDTWMRSNRLSINYNKTAYMILTATRFQKCNFKISMNGVRIQQTDNIKYLGVIVDKSINCNETAYMILTATRSPKCNF